MAALPSAGTTQWSSRFAFIMAAVGSSVGLGNLWRFSAEAGENGGGAFIIIYLACVIFIGIPVLMSEYIIGRAVMRRAPFAALMMWLKDLVSPAMEHIGPDGACWASFLIVSFYCVVAAWVIIYIPKFLGREL